MIDSINLTLNALLTLQNKFYTVVSFKFQIEEKFWFQPFMNAVNGKDGIFPEVYFP